MRHNGSLLEPVPSGRSLGQAMTIKLPSDLVAKLMGRPRISIKLGQTERVLIIGGEQFSLEEAKEETGTHDLYHQSDDSIVRVASIRSRLNMQRTLNQQVAAEVREKTAQAELEYRGKKISSVDEAPVTSLQPTAVTKRVAPSRQRVVPPTTARADAMARQRPGAKTAAKVPPAGASKTSQPATNKQEVRRQLVHMLAASDKGLSQAVLEKNVGLPIKDFMFVLRLVANPDKDVYKLNPAVYKEVDPNYDGYSPGDRAAAMSNKQKYNLELAVKPSPKPEKPPSTNGVVPEPATKKRKPTTGEVPPESLQLAKSSACPEEIPLEKLKHNGKYAKTLPEIANYQEYENYRKRFYPKHERYKELDQMLLANSKEFTDLAHQFERCTDRQEKKRLKDVILQRIAQKKESHQQMVVEWKTLHVELTEIKDRVSAYVQEYQKALTG